jgi:hypothetical protein
VGVNLLIKETTMILVRDVFRLQLGKAKEAVALWKEAFEIFEKLGMKTDGMRVLTDVVGDYYTLVFETSFEDLAAFENWGKEIRSKEEWKTWHARMLPLARDGHREIFNIVAGG